MWIDFLYLYLLGFGHKLIQKGRTKVKFQNLHFLILHPILMGVFFCAKRSFYGLLEYYEKCLLFYFEKRPKFWHFAYLECKIVKQDKCQAYNGSSIVLCPTHYRFQNLLQNTMFTLAVNLHLFNFPFSTKRDIYIQFSEARCLKYNNIYAF